MNPFSIFRDCLGANNDTVICHNCHVSCSIFATARGKNKFYVYPQKLLSNMLIDRLRISGR